jgi:hypothetical protein
MTTVSMLSFHPEFLVSFVPFVWLHRMLMGDATPHSACRGRSCDCAGDSMVGRVGSIRWVCICLQMNNAEESIAMCLRAVEARRRWRRSEGRQSVGHGWKC